MPSTYVGMMEWMDGWVPVNLAGCGTGGHSGPAEDGRWAA